MSTQQINSRSNVWRFSVCSALTCLIPLTGFGGVAWAQQPDPVVAAAVDTPTADAKVKTVAEIYKLTQTAKSAKDFSEIIVACEETLAADAQSPETKKSAQQKEEVRRLMAWTLCRRGEERVELAASLKTAGNQGQFEAVLKAALADFDQSMELASDRWKTYFSRSIVHAHLDSPTVAIADLNEAIRLNPKSRKALFNRAELLNWQGSFDAAIADYDAVLESKPKDVQAINGLAHAYMGKGEVDKAIELYTRVTELQPQNAVAWQLRGEAYEAQGQWKLAHADFTRGIKIQKSAQGYFKAAWLLSTCPDPDFFEPLTALEYAKQGKQFESGSVECLEVLAAASAANGQFEAAVELQKQAIAKTDAEHSDYKFDAEEMKIRLVSYEQEELYLQK